MGKNGPKKGRERDFRGNFPFFLHFFGHFCPCQPRDPPVLKILQTVNFGTGREFGTDVAKRYGEGSEFFFLH